MNEIKNMTDAELVQMTGYVICECPPDDDPCESCGEPEKQLYYLGPADAASYLCRECVDDEGPLCESCYDERMVRNERKN
jgi:hypothetical protein